MDNVVNPERIVISDFLLQLTTQLRTFAGKSLSRQLCAQLKSFPRDCCTHKSRHDFRKDQMTESGWKLTLRAFSVRFSFEIEKVAVPTIKMS